MKITDVIFCDDIRHEILNKFTLVGCYNDRIRASTSGEMKWPLQIKLGVYFRLVREESDFEPKKFQLFLSDSTEELVKLDGEIEMNDKDRPLIFTFVGNFAFKRPGPIHMKMNVKGDAGKETELDANLNFALEVVKS